MNYSKKRSVKTTMYIRIIAGLYLVYTDYTFLANWESIKADNNQIIMIVAFVIFAIAALLMIVFSLKKLMRINKESEQQGVNEDTEIKEQSK